MTESLLQEADRLYGLALADFTPARDARAKELKASDKDLAAAVKALKKPSVAAWVVNVLVRHETEQVEQVLAVGEALREAQQNMSGDELRTLTRQRRQLTAAVTTQARSLAKELGLKVTGAVGDQVEATLTAAMIDAGCAQAVRSGQLVAALAATGVDEVDLAKAVATPDALGFAASAAPEEPEQRPELHVVPDPDAEEKARAAAQEALNEAEQAVAEAASAHEQADADYHDLEARSLQIQAEIDELRHRIAELEEAAEEVDDELSDADDVRAEAADSLAQATRDRDAAARALDRHQT